MKNSDPQVLKMSKKLIDLASQRWVAESAVQQLFKDMGGALANDPAFHQRLKSLVNLLPDTFFEKGLRETMDKVCDQSAMKEDRAT